MRAAAPLGIALALVGCERIDFERMIEQPSLRPYEDCAVFADGRAMRHAPKGTIPRSALLGPPALVDGRDERGPVRRVPIQLDMAVLERGRDRFAIFCAACHGVLGYGDSQVAENMTLRRPRSLHDEEVRRQPAGRLFEVVSGGYGLMPGYEDKLTVADRWAVVAYVQALQLSQRARLEALPASVREEASTWLH